MDTIGHSMCFEYDGLNRLVGSTNENGHGSATTYQNEADKTSTLTYDSEGNITASKDFLGWETLIMHTNVSSYHKKIINARKLNIKT